MAYNKFKMYKLQHFIKMVTQEALSCIHLEHLTAGDQLTYMYTETCFLL